MLKLALIGPPHSGKSTIATAWLGIHPKGEDTAKLSFAEHLRWEVAEAFCLREDLDCQDLYFRLGDQSQKAKWRSLLQAWGQSRRDNVDENYWVDPVFARIKYLETRQYARCAVDDCRYPNEYAMLKNRGFTIIRLEPGPDTFQQLTDDQRVHQSEEHWPRFEYDYFLTYEEGAAHQARRIEDWLGKRLPETSTKRAAEGQPDQPDA